MRQRQNDGVAKSKFMLSCDLFDVNALLVFKSQQHVMFVASKLTLTGPVQMFKQKVIVIVVME